MTIMRYNTHQFQVTVSQCLCYIRFVGPGWAGLRIQTNVGGRFLAGPGLGPEDASSFRFKIRYKCSLDPAGPDNSETVQVAGGEGGES